jgi:kynurenine formamidase
VDQITPDRFVVPVAVLSSRNGQVGLEEVEDYERAHGPIPPGAMVALPMRADLRSDALEFLATGRRIYGLALDAHMHEKTALEAVNQGVYVVSQLGSMEQIPASGAIAVVAPVKAPGATSAPARVYALLR